MQQSCEELEQVRRRSEENDGYEWEHFKSWSKRSLEKSRPKWWVLKENCAFPSYSFPLLPVLSSLSVGTCSFLRLRESPLTWIPGDSALCLAWCVDILIQNFFKGNLCSCHCLEQEIHKDSWGRFFHCAEKFSPKSHTCFNSAVSLSLWRLASACHHRKYWKWKICSISIFTCI